MYRPSNSIDVHTLRFSDESLLDKYESWAVL